MYLRYFLTLVLFLLQIVSSHQALSKPHQKGLLSSIDAGVRFSSLLERRGVILYDDFQIDPVITLFFFDDRVEFLGNSIGFRDYLYKDIIRLRTKFSSVSDDPLFPSRESVRKRFPNRENTYEWTNAVEIFIPGYNEHYLAEINLNYSKDLKAHHGNYFELKGKIKLFSYQFLDTTWEPNFVSSIGWGGEKHNQYYYGPDDKQSGLNHYSLGLWLALPDKVDRYYPNFQVKYFSTTQSHENKKYSSGNHEGVLVSFITAFKVL